MSTNFLPKLPGAARASIDTANCAVVEHPAIAEVSVVRARERVRGEIPRAIVCLHSGESLSSNDVKAWCREHLAVYKIPRIVEFWTSLPRLPNGKIDRRVIEQTPIGKVA